MNSTRTSRSPKSNRFAGLLAFLAVVTLAAGVVHGAVIVEDHFSRSGNIVGTQPDTVATPDVLYRAILNGGSATTNGSALILAATGSVQQSPNYKENVDVNYGFTPTSPSSFLTLSANVVFNGGQWLAIGFTSDPTVGDPFQTTNGPWMLLNTAGFQTYLGPGIGGGKAITSPVPINLGTTYNLKITLDLDIYQATFYVDGNQIDQRDYITSIPDVSGFTLTFRDPAPSSNPTSPRNFAVFDDVILDDSIITAAVPEPSAWALLFAGATCLAAKAGVDRRRGSDRSANRA